MKATILIAEDDADIRDLMKLYLESEGYEILCSGDGAAADGDPFIWEIFFRIVSLLS